MESNLNQNRVVGAASVWPGYGVYSVTRQEAMSAGETGNAGHAARGHKSLCVSVIARVSGTLSQPVSCSSC